MTLSEKQKAIASVRRTIQTLQTIGEDTEAFEQILKTLLENDDTQSMIKREREGA